MLKWLNVLLVALPAAALGEVLGWRPAVIFGLALVSLIPLAGVISTYTEKLGEYLGDVAGGLLDATFGNAPEIIIGLLLITNIFNIVDSGVIVKALIIGSIVSNALFVLGSSTFVGALRNGRMKFSADRAGSYASMLALAVVGLALPALAVSLGNNGAKVESEGAQLDLSAVVSVVLLVCYGAYLAATVFGVGARGHAKKGGGGSEDPSEEAKAEREATLGTPVLGDHPSARETEVERLVAAEEDDEEAERRSLREKRKGHGREIVMALLIVAVATVLTVAASVLLLSEMDIVIRRTSLTPFFVGFILLPIVTNAVEQMGAIVSAVQNRMEQTMAVAAGSGVQMALLVAPLLMLASLALGHPLAETTSTGPIFGLVFGKLELIVVTLVTFIYALVSLDGETTWLEGLQLIASYAMVAAMAFFLPGA
jgi:Ca2+:H+ antiporter